jgi:AcrR family transcriptional regulator
VIQLKSIPLSERKKARNKLALINAAEELMRQKPLSEITVEELCEKVEISKSSFFAYFPRKTDLIFFNARLWSVEAVWAAKYEYGASDGLELIDAVFAWSGKNFEEHPRLANEVIALRASDPGSFDRMDEDKSTLVGPAERILRFSQKEGIESIREGTLITILRENLKVAIEKGELPKDTNFEVVILALASIFFGIPLLLGDQTSKNYSKEYSNQLALLWRALNRKEIQKPSRQPGPQNRL